MRPFLSWLRLEASIRSVVMLTYALHCRGSSYYSIWNRKHVRLRGTRGQIHSKQNLKSAIDTQPVFLKLQGRFICHWRLVAKHWRVVHSADNLFVEVNKIRCCDCLHQLSLKLLHTIQLLKNLRLTFSVLCPESRSSRREQKSPSDHHLQNCKHADKG